MRRLFVYVPPISGLIGNWETLRDRLQDEPECVDDDFRHAPIEHRHRLTVWSWRPIRKYARDVADSIHGWDQLADRRDRPYDQIILVGSSIGALLVRWAWLYRSGAFSPNDYLPWAGKVRRIVLVAGMNRGMSTRLEPGRRTLFIIMLKLAATAASILRLTSREALAGSRFVTEIRLTWIRFLASLRDQPERIPEVVQLLGTVDPLVLQEDSRDVEQFPHAAQVSIPGAGHNDILTFAGADGEDRYELLKSALLETTAPTEPPAAPKASATDVAFLVHGIRAGRYGWVTKLTRQLSAECPQWHIVRPTYGYFPALFFAIPVIRRRRARWFLDQYSREVAQHPTARFHFVGHSYGTYLLGRALRQVRAVRFERVYLAGSVLPTTYPWREYLDRNPAQVGAIRSDRGRSDVPVALLSNGLRGLFMRDIGGGGFAGFQQLAAPPAIEWGFFPGGHSAALDKHLDNVLKYVATGQASPPDDLIDDGGGVLALLSRAAPVLLPLLVIAVGVLVVLAAQVSLILAAAVLVAVLALLALV